MRLLYWLTRRRYGRTPTAFKVVYARAPFVGFLSLILVILLEHFTKLPKELCGLLAVTTARHNHCSFCADLGLAELVKAGIGTERFTELANCEESAAFTAREKAALAYARELSRSPRVSSACFARLRDHFDEREIIEIVWICGVERYFNSMAVPLRIGSDHLHEAVRSVRSR